MPLANKNYVSPAWIDNAAPPINDDELNAMSETVEGSQILGGNGAPTSATQGKVGQRYADISTTPPTIYRSNGQGFPGQPIPKAQTYAQLKAGGYTVAKFVQHDAELRVGSSNNRDVTVIVYGTSAPGEDNKVYVLATCAEPFTVYETNVYGSGTPAGVGGHGSGNTPDASTGLYVVKFGTGVGYHETDEIVVYAPEYDGLDAAMQAAANPPFMWEQEADPNRNLGQEYSTGSSYAAGDYCIYGGWLYKALEATSGAWDGSKWDRVRYADELSSHVSDKDNPHSVTAAQTGAASPSVLATVQETATAVRDYYAGDYFIYEGQLYALKENVEQGGDLFGPRTPETVSVYDMNTYYPVSAHSTPYAGAAITESGLELRQYRERNQVPISSGAKYFFWIDTKNGIVRYTMYSSDRDELQDITQTSPVLFITYGYEVRKQGDQFGFTVGGPGPDPKQAGELYYRTSAGPFDIQNHYRWLWPDDSVMFRGTEEEMVQFLSGIARYKKSEPAALGDGVTALYPKVGAVTISTFWGGSGPYSQTVTVTGADVTGKSKIDLTPTAAQLSQLTADGVLSLTIENVGGTLTAWAVGAQPSGAMTISCVVRETV